MAEGSQEKAEEHGFFQEIRDRWDTLTTSQRAYAGAMSLYIGSQVADVATQGAIFMGGGTEVGGLAPIAESFGPAGFFIAKIGGATLVGGAMEFLGRKTGERYASLPTVALATYSIITTPAIMNNVSELIKHLK